MVRSAELIVILELHQQGMTVSAIARRTGLHRSTVAKYVARGIASALGDRGLPDCRRFVFTRRWVHPVSQPPRECPLVNWLTVTQPDRGCP